MAASHDSREQRGKDTLGILDAARGTVPAPGTQPHAFPCHSRGDSTAAGTQKMPLPCSEYEIRMCHSV